MNHEARNPDAEEKETAMRQQDRTEANSPMTEEAEMKQPMTGEAGMHHETAPQRDAGQTFSDADETAEDRRQDGAFDPEAFVRDVLGVTEGVGASGGSDAGPRGAGRDDGFRLTDILPENAIEAGISASSRSLSGRLQRLRMIATMSKEANLIFGEMIATAMRQEAEVQLQRRETLMLLAKQKNYEVYRDTAASFAADNSKALLQVLETIAESVVDGILILFEKAQSMRAQIDARVARGAISVAQQARVEAILERMEREAVAALETWERRTRAQFDRCEHEATRSSGEGSRKPGLGVTS